MTTTATPTFGTPHQWDKEAPPTSWELAWNEALEAARPMLPDDVRRHLVEAANGRAIGAYDYGVACGIGQSPDATIDSSPELILGAIKATMERVVALTYWLEGRVA